MAKFILASSNSHKAEEINKYLEGSSIEVEAALEKLDVIEDGNSFQENALKKAQAYYNKYKQPVVSDDSGLVVEALPNDLGIHSARFGGPNLTDEQRARLLLEKLDGQEDRKAYFVCYLCFYLDENEIYFFEGRVHGKISDNYRGQHGFGYDPVFIPLKLNDNKTLAQVPDWKDLHSHRAVACGQAVEFFS